MDIEQHQEWRELEDRALEFMRGFGADIEDRVVAAGVIVVEPHGRGGLALVVLEPRPRDRHDAFELRRSVWRADLDLLKFRSPSARLAHPRHLQPTFELASALLPTARSRLALDRLEIARLPLRPRPDRLQLDGPLHEVVVGSSFSRAEFRWRGEVPPLWEPLEDFIRALRSLAERFLDDRDRRIGENDPI